MSLNAEIIAVGTELTNGAKLDTNSQWISRELEELGHPVRFHTSVADSLEDQVLTLRQALIRSDLVVMTGGLGPTLDDLARETIAAAIGDELKLHQESLETIEGFFRSRGRVMPERNRIQAMFPSKSEPLQNPIGTAPGIWYAHTKGDGSPCFLASLPGVPTEMKRMFQEQVLPRLPQSSLLIRKHVWHCFGLGESDVEQHLGELTARGRNPEVGITAHEATISLRIVARGIDDAECQTHIDSASTAIHAALGDRVFGAELTELEDIVLQLLHQRGWNLATLECGSSAFLASRMQRAATLSGMETDLIRGGFCFPTHEAAHAFLTRSKADASSYTSEVTGLAQLADDCRRLADADVCLAIAYPDLDQPDALREGDVVAIGRELNIAHRPKLLGTPDIQHSRLAKVAVDLLRRKLMSEP